MNANDLRPISWTEIKGQDKVVKGITNGIKTNTLSNVVALIGASGCGKTTIARLTAMSLNCHHPKADGSPCCECDSCKDILSERYSRDVIAYSGNDITIDTIKQIEEKLMYGSQFDKNLIMVINEIQLAKDRISKLLEVIETSKKGIYFIITSTDTERFTSVYGKDNKTQEKNAMRSRMSMFKIAPVNSDILMDMGFELLQKIDPDEKVPDTFIDECLPTIVNECKNNVRQLENDILTCLNSEVYTKQECIDLLNYNDEVKEYSFIERLAHKDTTVIKDLMEFESVEGFFPYGFTILTGIANREITGIRENLEWKEKSAQSVISTNNVESLLNCFINISRQCGAYFNKSVFFAEIYKYFKENTKVIKNVIPNTEEQKPVVKKIKKIAKLED